MSDDVYSELATRCHVSREFAKIWFLGQSYGRELDPWLDGVMVEELENILQEWSVPR